MSGRKKPAKPSSPAPTKSKDDRGEFRSIYVVLPHSPEFQVLTPEARACWYPLKLELGRAGIAIFYVETLRRVSGYPVDTCERVFEELRDTRWIETDGPIVWLRNGLRFEPGNPLGSPNGRKGVVKHLLTLPKLPIIKRFVRHYHLENEWCEATGERVDANTLPNPSEAPLEPLQSPFEAGIRDEGIGMKEEGTRITDNGDGSPEVETPRRSPAAVRAHVQAQEAPAEPEAPANPSSQDSSRSAGERRTPPDPAVVKAATDEMVVDVRAFTRAKWPQDQVRRRTFHAEATPIIAGDDYTAWADNNGDQVPWQERPRLLRLAISRVRAGESSKLRSALRYILPQQYDPFKTRSSEDSQYQNGNGKRAEGPTNVQGDAAATQRRIQEDAEIGKRQLAIAEWEEANAEQAAQLLEQVKTGIENDPEWKSKGELAIQFAVTGEYRRRIGQLLQEA